MNSLTEVGLISVLCCFAIAFYLCSTMTKRTIKGFFYHKMEFEKSRLEVFRLVAKYLDKKKISYIDIDVDSFDLKGKDKDELYFVYKCVTDNKIEKIPLTVKINRL